MQNRKSNDIDQNNTNKDNHFWSNTIGYAKKGAAYGGFFGSGLGFVAGSIEFRNRGYWPMGANPKGMLAAVGLFVGVSVGTIVGTSLGLFGAKKNQRVCQSNIMTDKANELQNINQNSLKK